ncbi:hypothetical protein J2T17_004430 [Paenibacillus mucilaginosus]|uniref:hypothetical protein n=1 Tax=Paenibacillus mucilaginosus TaxID=61624 RepID=UPI003D24052E
MGVFSYLCNGCGSNIRSNGFEGEQCVLQHIRHGELIGQVEGAYDGWGSVVGDKVFRRYLPAGEDHPNGQRQIGLSELGLPDSGKRSGIAAWHKVCFAKVPAAQQSEYRISRMDPKQGYFGGGPRPEFM